MLCLCVHDHILLYKLAHQKAPHQALQAALQRPPEGRRPDSEDPLAVVPVGTDGKRKRDGGWTEIATYPAQEAAKSGLLGKIMFPVNICLGAVKGVTREVVGVADFLTFWKDKNLADSWPGEEF
ncbi:MAG: hypothetical protein UT12_C0020G0008 [Candidatus Curtissbacteria bacterium GW2011_GWC2_38_9]|uniref:Uncharacterized protein n=1 Tax=Candidatus Curtissbacteria bacterium GW2011_GWC2_38_9 TaxID=1618414 RepID=A0A0G0LB26_9BACT|nr:MAG: hypothetical protein UT12_C0020G0008 [Candidatus Curtissbacteria bacterium GW2011_GWC2_38_9]